MRAPHHRHSLSSQHRGCSTAISLSGVAFTIITLCLRHCLHRAPPRLPRLHDIAAVPHTPLQHCCTHRIVLCTPALTSTQDAAAQYQRQHPFRILLRPAVIMTVRLSVATQSDPSCPHESVIDYLLAHCHFSVVHVQLVFKVVSVCVFASC